MATKTKNKTKYRGPNGAIRKPEDLKPAVFQSEFPNHEIVMESYSKNGNQIERGKRIDFSPNGTYETKNKVEIDFLKEYCKKAGPVAKVKMAHDIRLKDEKNKKKGKGDK